MIWEGLMLVKETEQLGPNEKTPQLCQCLLCSYVNLTLHCTGILGNWKCVSSLSIERQKWFWIHSNMIHFSSFCWTCIMGDRNFHNNVRDVRFAI